MGQIIISAQDEAVTTGGGETFAGLASPAFTGTPTAPTAATTTNTTQIATTAFVQQELGGISANAITEGNTNITITDTGSNGTISFVADGTTIMTIIDGNTTMLNGISTSKNDGFDISISATQNSTSSSADAYFSANVISSSAGDAFMRYYIQASNITYLMGIDNSDNDKLKIGAGSSLGFVDNIVINHANDDIVLNNNITIDSSGDILPSATSTIQNVGSPTDMWTNMYAAQFHGVATKAQYADLAENYVADADYENGTVLSFGGKHEVTVSTIDGDKRIAGIVSTAPAHLMNSTQTGEFLAAVALSGRAPCKVTGTVRKGDMMVSNGDGTARAEENPQMGQVIGKALEDFEGETGLIEVVVGRL